MSKQTINIGASPNDGTGTPLRTSFDYTNQNFTEIYTALGGGVAHPGATTQVIFNDGGTNLAGDAGLVYNKTTDALTVAGLVTAGSATITGDLTVDTSTLKVDSTNDRVGVGTATPAAGAKLSVLGTTVVSASNYVNTSTWSARFQAAANNQPSGIFLSGLASGGQVVPGSLHVEPVAASSRSALIATYSADSGVGYFAINRFSPSAGTTSQHYKIADDGVATWSEVGGIAGTAMTLNSTGLGVGVVPSAGNGAIQLSAGVGFPATQVASANANTLDDYEEGTFTPTAGDASSGGNQATTASAVGRYTKIGRLVTVHFELTDINTTGLTAGNSMNVRGLPFAASSATTQFGTIAGAGITFTGFLTCGVFNGSSFPIYATSTGGSLADIKVSGFASGTADIYGTLTYFV